MSVLKEAVRMDITAIQIRYVSTLTVHMTVNAYRALSDSINGIVPK